MNIVTLSGNLTDEPTVRSVNSELSVVSFSVANNDNRKKDVNTGDYVDDPCFIQVSYFTKKPDYWLQQLHKGAAVVISGQLRQDRWQADDGSNRSKHTIVLNQMQWPIVINRQKITQSNNTNSLPGPEDYGDDIPF